MTIIGSAVRLVFAVSVMWPLRVATYIVPMPAILVDYIRPSKHDEDKHGTSASRTDRMDRMHGGMGDGGSGYRSARASVDSRDGGGAYVSSYRSGAEDDADFARYESRRRRITSLRDLSSAPYDDHGDSADPMSSIGTGMGMEMVPMRNRWPSDPSVASASGAAAAAAAAASPMGANNANGSNLASSPATTTGTAATGSTSSPGMDASNGNGNANGPIKTREDERLIENGRKIQSFVQKSYRITTILFLVLGAVLVHTFSHAEGSYSDVVFANTLFTAIYVIVLLAVLSFRNDSPENVGVLLFIIFLTGTICGFLLCVHVKSLAVKVTATI